jgi:hypothetical protein
VSPCIPQFQTLLPVREGSGIAMCHMALSVLWATSKREILSRSTYSAGPTYLRAMLVRSRDTWHQAHHDLVRHTE